MSRNKSYVQNWGDWAAKRKIQKFEFSKKLIFFPID